MQATIPDTVIELSPRERWEATGYHVQYTQDELDTINARIGESESKIQSTNQTIINLRGQLGAANKLLDAAEEALAIPIGIGSCVPSNAHVAPLADKRAAEQAIGRISAQIADAELFLVSENSSLERWRIQKSKVNPYAIKAASALADLRQQIRK